MTFYAKAPAGAAAGSVLSLFGSATTLNVDEDLSDADLLDVSKATGETVEALAAKPWVRRLPSASMSMMPSALSGLGRAQRLRRSGGQPARPCRARTAQQIERAAQSGAEAVRGCLRGRARLGP